ncbi:hypothetical protein F2Q70_00014211 [Brassica cretica]|uniref:Uncharacterized protein n=1 Tax=Brassica cretica TaxID=69181 RepID=A0A8S9I564_BRACR|nr:hypothetical protein F2Q70_00014211 [Brassica cretica]
MKQKGHVSLRRRRRRKSSAVAESNRSGGSFPRRSEEIVGFSPRRRSKSAVDLVEDIANRRFLQLVRNRFVTGMKRLVIDELWHVTCVTDHSL